MFLSSVGLDDPVILLYESLDIFDSYLYSNESIVIVTDVPETDFSVMKYHDGSFDADQI